MSAKVYFILDQTEGRKKPFWSGNAYTYPLNYFLHVGVMLNIIKMSIILFLLIGIGNILVIFKTKQ